MARQAASVSPRSRCARRDFARQSGWTVTSRTRSVMPLGFTDRSQMGQTAGWSCSSRGLSMAVLCLDANGRLRAVSNTDDKSLAPAVRKHRASRGSDGCSRVARTPSAPCQYRSRWRGRRRTARAVSGWASSSAFYAVVLHLRRPLVLPCSLRRGSAGGSGCRALSSGRTPRSDRSVPWPSRGGDCARAPVAAATGLEVPVAAATRASAHEARHPLRWRGVAGM